MWRSKQKLTYLICDAERVRDLHRMDTTADTPEQAQQLAAEMAKQYGCRVYVLGVVGVVECPATVPQWVQPLAPGARVP